MFCLDGWRDGWRDGWMDGNFHFIPTSFTTWKQGPVCSTQKHVSKVGWDTVLSFHLVLIGSTRPCLQSITGVPHCWFTMDFFQQVLSIFSKKILVFVFPDVNSTTFFLFFKALPIFDITKLRVKTSITPVLPIFDSHH